MPAERKGPQVDLPKGSRLTGVAERPITPEMSRSRMSSHAQAKGTTRAVAVEGRQQADDAPAGRLKGASLPVRNPVNVNTRSGEREHGFRRT